MAEKTYQFSGDGDLDFPAVRLTVNFLGMITASMRFPKIQH